MQVSYLLRGVAATVVGVGVLLYAMVAVPGSAQAKRLSIISISVESPPDHPLTELVRQFADEVARASDGQVHLKLFDSARLYRDEAVAMALRDGKIDMAFPRISRLLGFLPALADTLHRHADDDQAADIDFGGVNLEFERGLRQRLNVMGFGAWVQTEPFYRFEIQRDTSAGRANRRVGMPAGCEPHTRLFAGEFGVAYSASDLPGLLANGEFGAFFGSPEDVISRRLWRFGIVRVSSGDGIVPTHVPLIRDAVWLRLPSAHRLALVDAWRKVSDDFTRSAQQRHRTIWESIRNAGIRGLGDEVSQLSR